MAYLTQKEFHELVQMMAAEMGLQRLRDKLVRFNALVGRRGVSSADVLANQLYMLTSGLRKQVPASIAVHGVWGEMLGAKLGEDSEKSFEELAKDVNACLDDSEKILPDKSADLEEALGAYAQALSAKVGREAAYLDMLLKAVPPVAEMLRAKGLPEAPAKEGTAEGPAAESVSGAGEGTSGDSEQ